MVMDVRNFLRPVACRHAFSVRGSREHLRFALEAARLGTWEWDASRQQLSLAGYAAELLGLPGETDAIDPEAFAALI